MSGKNRAQKTDESMKEQANERTSDPAKYDGILEFRRSIDRLFALSPVPFVRSPDR